MIPLDAKEEIQQIGLEYCFFSQIVKIKGTIVGEIETTSKRKQKYQYLNLKVSWRNQKSGLIFNKTGFKIISIQEKRIFTTFCFNDTFLVKKTMTLYFKFPLEVPKKPIWVFPITMPL